MSVRASFFILLKTDFFRLVVFSFRARAFAFDEVVDGALRFLRFVLRGRRSFVGGAACRSSGFCAEKGEFKQVDEQKG